MCFGVDISNTIPALLMAYCIPSVLNSSIEPWNSVPNPLDIEVLWQIKTYLEIQQEVLDGFRLEEHPEVKS